MATQGEAAKHVGISRRQFVDLIDAGHISRQSEGGYDLGEVARQVIAYYRDRTISELDKQRARAAQSQADKNEVEIAERLKKLLPLELFEAAWMKIVTVFRTNALAMPRSRASRFVGLKTIAEAEERLRQEVDELLRSISATDPRRALGVGRKGAGRGKAADQTDGLAMGG